MHDRTARTLRKPAVQAALAFVAAFTVLLLLALVAR